jgi:hypothetical protein
MLFSKLHDVLRLPGRRIAPDRKMNLGKRARKSGSGKRLNVGHNDLANDSNLGTLFASLGNHLPHPAIFHKAYNGSIPCGARFPLMPNEQVL